MFHMSSIPTSNDAATAAAGLAGTTAEPVALADLRGVDLQTTLTAEAATEQVAEEAGSTAKDKTPKLSDPDTPKHGESESFNESDNDESAKLNSRGSLPKGSECGTTPKDHVRYRCVEVGDNTGPSGTVVYDPYTRHSPVPVPVSNSDGKRRRLAFPLAGGGSDHSEGSSV